MSETPMSDPVQAQPGPTAQSAPDVFSIRRLLRLAVLATIAVWLVGQGAEWLRIELKSIQAHGRYSNADVAEILDYQSAVGGVDTFEGMGISKVQAIELTRRELELAGPDETPRDVARWNRIVREGAGLLVVGEPTARFFAFLCILAVVLRSRLHGRGSQTKQRLALELTIAAVGMALMFGAWDRALQLRPLYLVLTLAIPLLAGGSLVRRGTAVGLLAMFVCEASIWPADPLVAARAEWRAALDVLGHAAAYAANAMALAWFLRTARLVPPDLVVERVE